MLLRYIQSVEEQKKILLACHVDPTAGHMGREKTFHRIKERFMWLGMYKDIRELVWYCIHYCSDAVCFIVIVVFK